MLLTILDVYVVLHNRPLIIKVINKFK